MKPLYKNILIGILAIAVIGLLARYVVFKDRIDAWGEGLERVGAWQDDYRRQHPGASDEEVDAAFNAASSNVTVWQEQYKREHPDATKEEMDAAFNAMFEKR